MPIEQSGIKTIIEGSTIPEKVKGAVDVYFDGLSRLAYPSFKIRSPLTLQTAELKPIFEKRLNQVAPDVADIIVEINRRWEILRREEYGFLFQTDISAWNNQGKTDEDLPIFGALVCVDKGIPSEAIMGLDGVIGRTLAGDIQISHIPSKKSFIAVESPILKKLIHSGREEKHNGVLIEPMIVHTSCGRMNQILTNQSGTAEIPLLDDVFDNLDNLISEFSGNETENHQKIEEIVRLWKSLERNSTSIITPDGGVYAGVVNKLAQRQALSRSLEGHMKNTIIPIEIYDKNNGDLIVGVDDLSILTNPEVLEAKGFTTSVIDSLAQQGKIFSIKSNHLDIFKVLKANSNVTQGSKTYKDLQEDWLTTQESLVNVTCDLWDLYDSGNSTIKSLADKYIEFVGKNAIKGEAQDTEIIKRRLLHHLFHAIAYTYVLDTFNRGNEPGHHIEDHLAIGDHDVGAKIHMPLGQGDLERPSASEMFTGYSVLLHSKPGEENKPVIAMIKLDTAKSGKEKMSTEETSIALEDFKEFLKLWPYFLVGDIIPVIAVRGKIQGGISRLALSIILTFGDTVDLYEQKNSPLPKFVPASTSDGKLVYVPAVDVLEAGKQAGDNLKLFRENIKGIANQLSNPDLQAAIQELMRR